MLRNFSLHSEPGGKCVLKEEGDEAAQEFADLLDAVSYVRRQKGENEAVLKFYDFEGRLIFKQIL